MAFSYEDGIVASRALSIYMHEINGAGLRWELDVNPRNIDGFLQRDYKYFGPKAHAEHPTEYTDRVQHLGNLAAHVSRFVDRPITIPTPMRYLYDHSPATVERTVTEGDAAVFAGFHTAVKQYFEAVVEKGRESEETLSALRQVGFYVRPEQWTEAGYEIPSDAEPGVTGTGLRWYLEDVSYLTTNIVDSEAEKAWKEETKLLNP